MNIHRFEVASRTSGERIGRRRARREPGRNPARFRHPALCRIGIRGTPSSTHAAFAAARGRSPSRSCARSRPSSASRSCSIRSARIPASCCIWRARRSFPAPTPFPLLHVDTTWKFREMIAFRDSWPASSASTCCVHVNREGLARGIDPIASGSALHTQVMKTEALKQALDAHGFDAALGGARRDEEKPRQGAHLLVPQRQPCLGSAQPAPGTVEPVQHPDPPAANWFGCFRCPTGPRLDVWSYIAAEDIPVVPLYFAKPRPVVRRSGALIMVDDERLPLEAGEIPQMRTVRFRTLGCYPLTGAIEFERRRCRRSRRRNAGRRPSPSVRAG